MAECEHVHDNRSAKLIDKYTTRLTKKQTPSLFGDEVETRQQQKRGKSAAKKTHGGTRTWGTPISDVHIRSSLCTTHSSPSYAVLLLQLLMLLTLRPVSSCSCSYSNSCSLSSLLPSLLPHPSCLCSPGPSLTHPLLSLFSTPSSLLTTPRDIMPNSRSEAP